MPDSLCDQRRDFRQTGCKMKTVMPIDLGSFGTIASQEASVTGGSLLRVDR